MTRSDDGIERGYVDALGRRHGTPPDTRLAIRRAMAAGRRGRAARRGVIVVTEGERAAIGKAEVRLEDGTPLTVDRDLPPDLPAGYHEVVRRSGTTDPLIVAPAHCFLPESLRGSDPAITTKIVPSVEGPRFLDFWNAFGAAPRSVWGRVAGSDDLGDDP